MGLGACASEAGRQGHGNAVRVVRRRLAAGERENLGQHAFVEFYHIQSGRGTLVHSGQNIVAAAYQLLAIPPGVEHALVADAGWACGAQLVQFDADLLPPGEARQALAGILRRAGSGQGAISLRGNTGQVLARLVTRVGQAALCSGCSGGAEACRTALADLCVRLWRHCRDTGVGQPEQPNLAMADTAQDGSRPEIDQVLAYIERNLTRPISREDLARQAAFAPSYFSALFREATGTTIPEYINARRVHRAQELLRQPQTRVSSVCYAVGFRDLSNFNRVFKRLVGQTPREYRQALFADEIDADEEAASSGLA